MNIICFNGPPFSGKDTAAMYIYNNRHSFATTIRFDRMSMPFKHAFAGMTNTYPKLDKFGNNAEFEPIKDKPILQLNGKSYRQWQIDFSEKFMKPLYGEDIFARLFVSRVGIREYDTYTYVVPDCGFPIEARAVRAMLPKAHLIMVRIHRDGTDFSNDSRGYLHGDCLDDWNVLDVHNNGTQRQFEDLILHYAKDWIA